MSLDDWDKRIAPRLQDLEYCGNKIAYYARHIALNAQNLPCRPSWETLARDALETAEKDLRVALAVVQAAKEKYDTAPIGETLQAAE